MYYVDKKSIAQGRLEMMYTCLGLQNVKKITAPISDKVQIITIVFDLPSKIEVKKREDSK